MTGIPFHPFANAFPYMSGDEFKAFVADVETHGLREPITLYQDAILEGRHRYRACLQLKIEPRFEQFEGDDAAAYAFVVSRNLHRRHLKPADKKKVIADLIKLKPERSDRSIAKAAGVSPTTVGMVREEVEATVQCGQLSESGAENPAPSAENPAPSAANPAPEQKRIGADGKARRQPAKKKTSKSKAERRNERARPRRIEKRRQEAEERAKVAELEEVQAKAKADQLAADLSKAGLDQRVLAYVTWKDDLLLLEDALKRRLRRDPAPEGNGADAQASADQRKAEFAELDGGAS